MGDDKDIVGLGTIYAMRYYGPLLPLQNSSSQWGGAKWSATLEETRWKSKSK